MSTRSVSVACVSWLVVVAGASGCGGGTTSGNDTGSGGVDAFVALDAGTTVDGGTDAGMSVDVGTGGVDTGSADGGSADGGSAGDAGCLATLGALNRTCASDGECPAGFVCQPFSGAVLQMQCEIRCDDPSFSCPCGTACMDHSDKATSWRQCDQL